MLEKELWNSFLLYLLVEILQLVHEISSFSEVLYKRGVFKNFSKVTDKLKKSSEGVLAKDVLKNFTKFTNLVFNKVASWKSETFRSSHWRCSVKWGVLNNFANLSKMSLFNKAAVLRGNNFIKKTLTQVLSSEICKIFKNNYFEDYIWKTVLQLKCVPVNFVNYSRTPVL